MRIAYALKYEVSHLQNWLSIYGARNVQEALTFILVARSSSSHQLLWTSVPKFYL
jgi:hypothetical protein